ncbi:hypothetical protein FDP41_009257 [Naegleria fowleri]|uniref:Uncharacterized protein n=1 Tax=Naegleria fowleri TaxID=5763 RepID=A0A6A5BE45_NAEFO|nr:uncharacterized protein FDP41_009257 [Naegleria fowleri]KAF0972354.1 hypothetical protein FDP41_009257 [Naegleria fowleri]CAG4719096.1 unnamed protein product [Naegleria fowleri]
MERLISFFFPATVRNVNERLEIAHFKKEYSRNKRGANERFMQQHHTKEPILTTTTTTTTTGTTIPNQPTEQQPIPIFLDASDITTTTSSRRVTEEQTRTTRTKSPVSPIKTHVRTSRSPSSNQETITMVEENSNHHPSSCRKSENTDQEQQLPSFTKPKAPSLCSLMMCGTLGSGKSTLFRQFRVTLQEGFNSTEVDRMRMYLFSNMLNSFGLGVAKFLNLLSEYKDFGISAIAHTNIPEEYFNNEQVIQQFVEYKQKVGTLHSRHVIHDSNIPYGDIIISMWEDPRVREILNAFAVSDSFSDGLDYYLRSQYDSPKRMLSKTKRYEPILDDIISCRTKTTGITYIDFDFLGTSYRVFDVGGARTERKKYENVYPGLTGAYYTASLIDYRKTCYEDDFSSRFIESTTFFDTLCNGPLKYSPIFLVFTKLDIFKQTFEGETTFSRLCPEYAQYDPSSEHQDFSTFFNDLPSQSKIDSYPIVNPNPSSSSSSLSNQSKFLRYLLDEEIHLTNEELRVLSFIENSHTSKLKFNTKRVFIFYMTALDTNQFKKLVDITTSILYQLFSHTPFPRK